MEALKIFVNLKISIRGGKYSRRGRSWVPEATRYSRKTGEGEFQGSTSFNDFNDDFETVGRRRPVNMSATIAALRRGLSFGNVGTIIVEFIALVPCHRVIHRGDYSDPRAVL